MLIFCDNRMLLTPAGVGVGGWGGGLPEGFGPGQYVTIRLHSAACTVCTSGPCITVNTIICWRVQLSAN